MLGGEGWSGGHRRAIPKLSHRDASHALNDHARRSQAVAIGPRTADGPCAGRVYLRRYPDEVRKYFGILGPWIVVRAVKRHERVEREVAVVCRSVIAAKPSGRRLRICARAMCFWSPARAMKPARLWEQRFCRSVITRPSRRRCRACSSDSLGFNILSACGLSLP